MKLAVDMLQNMDEVKEQRASYAVERSPFVSPSRAIATDNAIISAADRAITAVGEGIPLKKALAAEGLSLVMFQSCISGQRELGLRYARAQEMRADILVDEAIEAADSDIDPAKARNMMTVRQWAASKYNSKRYGDRIDLNVTQTLDITSTLLEARQRALRPVSDQQPIEDAQVVDATVLSLPEPPDSQSEVADPGPEPDIFAAPTPAPAQAPTDEDVPDIFS